MAITLAHTAPARLDWHRLGQARPEPRLEALAAAHAEAAARDNAFVALQAAYRSHGGIAQGESLAACLGRGGHGGYVDLARRIVAAELFSFRWNDHFWVPLFQFDPQSLALRTAPRQVLDALRNTLGGWDIAHWYVRPHAALRGRRPIDLLDSDLPAVLAAALDERPLTGLARAPS